MTRTYNPRWMPMIRRLLDSPANDQRSARDNSTMLAIMEPIILNLTVGVALSQKQQAALIENIRRRVPGQQNFTFDGVIALTKEQRRALRKMKNAAQPITPGSEPEARFNTKTTPQSHLNNTVTTPIPHRNNTAITPGTPSNPSAIRDFERSTILNCTELNSTPEGDHSLVARGPDQKLEMIAGLGFPREEVLKEPVESIEEIFGHLGMALETTPEEIARDRTPGPELAAVELPEEERLAIRENALQGLAERGDKAVLDLGKQRPTGPLAPSIRMASGASLDLWYDGINSCRGELQFNGARYFVNFTHILGAEARLGNARQEGGDYAFGEMIAQAWVVPMSRRDLNRDAPAYRFAASPVYFDRSLETGIFRQAFVLLEWNGQSADRAIIADGPNFFTVDLAVNPSTAPKAPSHKGKAKAA